MPYFPAAAAGGAAALPISGDGLTVTVSTPLVSGTQTWNASGVAFEGDVMTFTSTASAAGSSVFRRKVGATTVFDINKTGDVVLDRTSAAGSTTKQLQLAAAVGLNSFSSGLGLVVSDAFKAYLTIPYFSHAAAFALGPDPSSPDVFLERDAANTVAQRNGTTAQTSNHYDTWVSATDYHRLAMKTARATLSGVSGATVTATGLIPDGAVVVGVTTKVTTGLGTGGGTSGYQIGDGSDADRWGTVTGTIAGTSTDNRDWTATTVQAFTAASDVVITANGGSFNGTGVIYVSVQYLIGQSD